MYDWNALALFGVVALGMSTSATLLVRAIVGLVRGQRVSRDTPAACSC